MELTTHEYDEITEIQCNLNDFELDEAIGQLRPEALAVLCEECQANIARQKSILVRIQSRLAQN